jgi:hypothetical protein
VFSEAFPTRLTYERDSDGRGRHLLGGVPVPRYAVLQLQLADGTWLSGTYDWDQPAEDTSFSLTALPLLRLDLAKPTWSPEALQAVLYLPDDAVLRLHPKTKRALRPRR